MTDKDMAYSIAAVPYYLKVAEAVKINVALVGAHGRAKTSFINQYGQDNGYDEVIPINLSQLSPEDMVGLPVISEYKNEKVTSYSCPDWLAKACDPDKKVILFFDEFTNGEDDTQASILKLIDERELLGHKLNESTLIVMAYNPPEIAPNARSLSKATRDRICAIPIEDRNNKAYKDYYTSNSMDILTSLLNDVPEMVCDYTDEVSNCAYENAEFTYRSIVNAYKICEYVSENNLPDFVSEVMCRGYGGKVLGDTFVKYFKDNYVITSVTKKIADISKKAKSGNDVINGLKKANISIDDADFATLMRIVSCIEDNADNDVFRDFMDKGVTKEFSVAYYTESNALPF